VRAVICLASLLGAAGFAAPVAAQVTVSGGLSGEIRAFPERPPRAEQDGQAAQPAFIGEARLEAQGPRKRFMVTFNPYVRYDAVDGQRSVFDLHELKVSAGGQRWHVKAGYDVEFWGVMEIVNPVNVLNQTDVTEGFLTKRKLGQLMVDYTLLGNFGTIDFYALGGFQPMRFPTATARLSPAVPIHQDDVIYGSGRGRSQLEGAVRYFRNVRNVYFGVSQFYGYARDPEMLVAFDSQGLPFVAARYDLEHQTGVEVQVTFGNVILKSEDVFRADAHGRRSHALSAGSEYDLGSVLQSGRTISLFAEYYFDSRSQSLVIPFRNDVFAGTRVSLNDRRSSEVRVWGNYDLSARRATAIMVDASARLSERLKAVVTYRGIIARQDALASIARDSHLVFKLEAFF
jgi:hypothetical protein